MECYAPLFVNMNPGTGNWRTNLIGYDAVKSFGSLSYYTQVMFSNNKGDQVLPYSGLTPQTIPPAPTPAPAPAGRRGGGGGTAGPANEPLFVSTTKDDTNGDIILKMVNVREVEQTMEITIAGAPVQDGRFRPPLRRALRPAQPTGPSPGPMLPCPGENTLPAC